MQLYIAGPMRGIPDFNFPAFDAARDRLNAAGHRGISPADSDRSLLKDRPGAAAADLTPEECMQRDIELISMVDGIVLLEGWEYSSGAITEIAFARFRNIPVFVEGPWMNNPHHRRWKTLPPEHFSAKQRPQPPTQPQPIKGLN